MPFLHLAFEAKRTANMRMLHILPNLRVSFAMQMYRKSAGELITMFSRRFGKGHAFRSQYFYIGYRQVSWSPCPATVLGICHTPHATSACRH